MEHREDELGMAFSHIDATERMLAEPNANANEPTEAATWILKHQK